MPVSVAIFLGRKDEIANLYEISYKGYFPKYTLKNKRLKITQLEKAHFIKVNELKLTEVELFRFFFHFMCVAVNASELFCMAY